jgi:hypothetical protein
LRRFECTKNISEYLSANGENPLGLVGFVTKNDIAGLGFQTFIRILSKMPLASAKAIIG